MRFHKSVYNFLDGLGVLYVEEWLVVTNEFNGSVEISLTDNVSRFNNIVIGIANDKGFRPYSLNINRFKSWNTRVKDKYEKTITLQKLIDKL